MRAALFRNVSSPVSAVLLLFLVAHRFLCQSCPPPTARQDFHLNNTTFLSLDCLHPLLSDIHLVLIRLLCGLRPLNPSFIHAYSYVQSCLVLCVIQLRQKSKIIFFTPPTLFILRVKERALELFFKKTKTGSLEELWTDTSGTKEERVSHLIFYFTHQQHVVWRGYSKTHCGV